MKKNKIIKLGENSRKVFLLTDDKIIMSSKEHKNIDTLIASAEEGSKKESIKIITIKSIQELFFNEKKETFTIKYEYAGKIKEDSILLSGVGLRNSLLSEIAEQKKFTRELTTESKIKPLLLNILAGVIIAVSTFVTRGMAIDAQNGINHTITGRKGVLKKIIMYSIELIGPTGIMIIGLLAIIYLIYILRNRYNNPASEIKFS